ncbi:MAG TPA: DsbA family protein [Stellaceae bacterium]|nr:DsbA family protein [Stellaceae bacterium]
MRKIWFAPGLLLMLVLGFGSLTPPAEAQSETPTVSPSDRILGKPDAPITIFEYASLTCPHCAAFEKETLPKIKAEWIDTGKAKLILRDFPLDGSALKAAVLARCAPPDRFYGFIETLFASQDIWARGSDPTQALERIAKVGGMNDQQFQACMKNDAVQNEVLAMRLAGEKQYGVESTPTFFINGKKLVGAQPYEKFEELLKAAAPKA